VSYTYNYVPLQYADSIRLLTLLPGDFDSPIQISIAEVRSKDNHSYEALSYTWATEDGDCRRSSQIKCDDTRIWVTKSCELALRYLRKSDTNRILWVDAICINQKDLNERGHQVGIMRDVYSKATEVLIWLGEASKDFSAPLPINHSAEAKSPISATSSIRKTAPGSTSGSPLSSGKFNGHESRRNDSDAILSVSEIFLEFLGRMGIEITRLRNEGEDPRSSPLYKDLVSQVYSRFLGGVDTELCRGFKDIVNRRWWSRVWVIQEVVVARSATLICSKQSTKYSNFFDWYQLIESEFTPEAISVWNNLDIAYNHFKSVSVWYAQRAYQGPEKPTAFLSVLRRVRRLTASNPRDKIFGVLGLSDQFKILVAIPDYNKTTTEVFTDVAKVLLRQTKSLALLQHATSSTPVFGHPSWVPYWSHDPVTSTRGGLYNTARNSEAIFAFSCGGQELRVKGKDFDQVKTIPLADLEAYQYSVSTKPRFEGWQMSCNVGFSLSTYPTGEPVEEALWRTLCWNVDYMRHSYPAPKETGDCFREWYRILSSIDTVENKVKKISVQDNSFRTIINHTASLCTTSNGYLASVPYTTEVGDFIVVLAGGDYPFVLRPTGDHYRLVGPCYVHGIMDGEAFPEDPEELEWFSIR